VLANYGSSYAAPRGYGEITTGEIVSRVGEILAAIDSPRGCIIRVLPQNLLSLSQSLTP
jgi:hypothetical protein